MEDPARLREANAFPRAFLSIVEEVLVKYPTSNPAYPFLSRRSPSIREREDDIGHVEAAMRSLQQSPKTKSKTGTKTKFKTRVRMEAPTIDNGDDDNNNDNGDGAEEDASDVESEAGDIRDFNRFWNQDGVEDKGEGGDESEDSDRDGDGVRDGVADFVNDTIRSIQRRDNKRGRGRGQEPETLEDMLVRSVRERLATEELYGIRLDARQENELISILNQKNDMNADINIGDAMHSNDTNGFTLLHYAARYGIPPHIDLLREYGARLNETDNEGRTPLYISISANNEDAFKYLLSETGEHGLIIADGKGRYPIHVAATKDTPYYMQEILECSSQTIDKYEDTNHHTPLHLAIMYKRLDIVKLLINMRATMGYSDKEGNSAYHHAAASSDMEILLEVIGTHELIDSYTCRNTHGEGIIHVAARVGFIRGIYFLVSKGIDINSLDRYGRSAMFALVTNPNNTYEMCKRFLNLGFNVFKDIQDVYGNSIIHILVYRNRPNLIELFSTDRNINAINVDGRTPAAEALILTRDSCFIKLNKLGAQMPSSDEVDMLCRKHG